MDVITLLLSLTLGALGSWLATRWFYRAKQHSTGIQAAQDAYLLLERIEKVFKVVFAEGYFTEIYDHASKRHVWGIFRAHSKALIVARAKVSVGFDFSKMRFSRDHQSKQLIIEQFAQPEILSVDTDYQFYDLNQGMMNKFDRDDYTAILAEAKRIMKEKAQQSELPQLARKQIELMLNELCSAAGWTLVDRSLNLTITNTPAIDNAAKSPE